MGRVLFAIIYVLGQIVVISGVCFVFFSLVERGPVHENIQVVLFFVSVYFGGFLVAPITVGVLIAADNAMWARICSALAPLAFAAFDFAAQYVVGRELEAGELSIIALGLVSAIALLAYDRLFSKVLWVAA